MTLSPWSSRADAAELLQSRASFEKAMVELLRKKQAGRVVEPIRDAEPESPRVINLMDALRASLKGEAKKPAAASTPARRTTKKKATR